MPDQSALVAIRPADLPAPPQTALEILQACAGSDVDTKRLANIVSRDPVLTAELLRMANSAFFGLAREVRTVQRAVMVLGQRALRNLVLCITMRKAIPAERLPGFDVAAFWEDSLRRGAAARQLGLAQRVAPDECLTLGLLQDFGLLVMLHAMPAAAARWDDLRGADPDTRLRVETDLFGTTHDAVGAMLASAWALPAELGTPLGAHHGDPPGDATPLVARLCRIARCADWMAAVYATGGAPATVARCRELLAEHFQVDADTCQQLLAAMADAVEEAAQALGLRVRKQVALDTVLRQANKHLVDEALSYQELTWRLEHALRERDRLAAELNRELELAREIQQNLLPREQDPTLPITGVNISARVVSGDFYDYFRVGDGRILFNLADVSGKGMNAALLMAKTSSLFHCLGKSVTNPAELLALLNDELCESATRGMFVTMIGGLFEPATGRIALVNAGHPPALCMDSSGRVTEFPAEAPPLGLSPGQTYPRADFCLDGGSLFMFSDGLSECTAEGEAPLGIAGIKRLLVELRGLSRTERLGRIVERVRQPGQTLRDDLTLLAVGA